MTDSIVALEIILLGCMHQLIFYQVSSYLNLLCISNLFKSTKFVVSLVSQGQKIAMFFFNF